jgi:hypothetical protein
VGVVVVGVVVGVVCFSCVHQVDLVVLDTVVIALSISFFIILNTCVVLADILSPVHLAIYSLLILDQDTINFIS